MMKQLDSIWFALGGTAPLSTLETAVALGNEIFDRNHPDLQGPLMEKFLSRIEANRWAFMNSGELTLGHEPKWQGILRRGAIDRLVEFCRAHDLTYTVCVGEWTNDFDEEPYEDEQNAPYEWGGDWSSYWAPGLPEPLAYSGSPCNVEGVTAHELRKWAARGFTIEQMADLVEAIDEGAVLAVAE